MSRVCVNAREVKGEVSVSGDFMEEPGTALYPAGSGGRVPSAHDTLRGP